MKHMVKVLEPLQITTTALSESEIVSCTLVYRVVNGLLKNHLVVDKNDHKGGGNLRTTEQA